MVTQLSDKDYLMLIRECLSTSKEDISKQLEGVQKAKILCDFLESNDIHYDAIIRHKIVHGCDESINYYKRFEKYIDEDYAVCKNLLVHERKGDKRTFLIIVDANKKVDLHKLRERIETRKLEFTSDEEMKELLDTESGNLSIFNIMNDKDRKVELVMDEELFSRHLLAFHPLYNGMSMFITTKEIRRFLRVIRKDVNVLDIPEAYDKILQKTMI